jgi:hypothetical protein
VNSPGRSRGLTEEQAEHAAAWDSGQENLRPCSTLSRSPCPAHQRAASPRRALQDVKARLRRFAHRRSRGSCDLAAADADPLPAYLTEDYSCDKVRLTVSQVLPHSGFALPCGSRPGVYLCMTWPVLRRIVTSDMHRLHMQGFGSLRGTESPAVAAPPLGVGTSPDIAEIDARLQALQSFLRAAKASCSPAS